MIKITSKGDFNKTFLFFDKLQDLFHVSDLDKYGKMGVDALKSATPIDTGKTADSWIYHIEREKGGVSIVWDNTNVINGSNIAILIQYGHATANHSGYVYGRDYINPAIRPVFDKIAEEMWKEVNHL